MIFCLLKKNQQQKQARITLMMSMRMGEAITQTAAVKQLFHQKQVNIILVMRIREAITKTAEVKQLFQQKQVKTIL
jgi:hypothetical protein